MLDRPMVPRTRTPTRSRNAGNQLRKLRARVLAGAPVALCLLGLVGMPTLLVKSGGLGRLGELVRERDLVEMEISRMSRKVTELEARALAAKEQPAAVERSARDHLGYVRRNEVVYQFQVLRSADLRSTKQN